LLRTPWYFDVTDEAIVETHMHGLAASGSTGLQLSLEDVKRMCTASAAMALAQQSQQQTPPPQPLVALEDLTEEMRDSMREELREDLQEEADQVLEEKEEKIAELEADLQEKEEKVAELEGDLQEQSDVVDKSHEALEDAEKLAAHIDDNNLTEEIVGHLLAIDAKTLVRKRAEYQEMRQKAKEAKDWHGMCAWMNPDDSVGHNTDCIVDALLANERAKKHLKEALEDEILHEHRQAKLEKKRKRMECTG